MSIWMMASCRTDSRFAASTFSAFTKSGFDLTRAGDLMSATLGPTPPSSRGGIALRTSVRPMPAALI
ncbi:hypothetical protein D7M15_22625 [Streptomyces sp. Z26]|nr:hypothetical protein D7M15_22625 [Streptomyces sp. Z26]